MYIGITKEVKEKYKDFNDIMERIYPILDDIGHNAISIKETYYIWGKGENRDTHRGFEIEYVDNTNDDDIGMDFLKLGAFVYAINKEFKGAKAVLTIDNKTFPVYFGVENAVKKL
jgi:hypothetical protein